MHGSHLPAYACVARTCLRHRNQTEGTMYCELEHAENGKH
jgi:hypothetical protein